MATARYNQKLKRWQVRWHITCPYTKDVICGSKLLPAGCTKYDADQIAAEKNALAKSIKLGSMPARDTLVKARLAWLRHNKQHTARTQDLYRRTIEKFFASLPPDVRRIGQLQPSHVIKYIQGIDATAATKNRHLSTIKSFCSWLSQTYNIANSAVSVKKQKEDPPRVRFLTIAEYKAVLKIASADYRRRIEFIANTGLRASEFAQLTWRCVSADSNSITITGKGRKRRTIPLNQTCRKILAALKTPQIKNDAPIFLSKSLKKSEQKKPCSRKALLQMCNKLAAAAGIENFGPHALRHFFITQLSLAGVPVKMVSVLVGHASIKTTEKIYTHILPRDLRGLTDCLAI